MDSIPNLIATNVNTFSGSLLLICSYTPSIDPELVTELSRGRSAFSFCPELCHLDVLGLKMTTIFRLGRVTDLTVLTKDGSPHSMQIPLMVQEAAENASFDKANIRYIALESGKAHKISDLTVRKARHYSEVEALLPIARLEKVTEILRGEGGCKNDRAETFASIVEHLKEETGEIAEALVKEDIANLEEEIGDVLFNLFLMAQIGKERKLFSMSTIANRCAQKMIDRHPGVFVNRKYKY